MTYLQALNSARRTNFKSGHDAVIFRQFNYVEGKYHYSFCYVSEWVSGYFDTIGIAGKIWSEPEYFNII